MDEILFTPASLLDLLSQIDELKDVDIQVVESSGQVQLHVGESTYNIETQNATEIEVPDEVVEEVADVGEEAYSEISQTSAEDIAIEDDPEVVESGILKEIAKTLLVGGMVRLSSKILKG